MFNFFSVYKRKILIVVVGIILYVLSQADYYDIGSLFVHIAVNVLVFYIVSTKLVRFAESFMSRRKQLTVRTPKE